MFKPVNPQISFAQLEEEILQYWKKHKIFEKSIESRPADKTWTFLDGPPFITGLPHYGTLLVSIAKDIFPRFWTMKGYRVRRVWGWDVHGLPAENKVETKLGIKSKREIVEKIGLKKFIDECKLYVSESSKEWEWYISHIGRWVDFVNAYKTMDLSYMETVMWVFRQMYDKGHIYKGLRVSLYCPHCATPISNFEVAMDADNYKESVDPATIYKYQLQEKKDVYFLAWSTTPWNKIVTPALAVNPKLIYVKVQPLRQAQGKQEKYILAKSTLKTLVGEYKILEEFKGQSLLGKEFVPHYDYYPIGSGEIAFQIVGGDFVTAEEGTGIVTIAAYGEEDLQVMKRDNIHIEMHLDDEGNIKPDVPLFGGIYYLKANKAVNEDLAKRNLIYKNENLSHSIPLCWRCHTRLYYAPQNAWFVSVQALKPKLKKNNETINWFPKHFKYGRFLKSLEAAPDWCISRSRYWGSPVPVWECECKERFIPGSIRELEEASGQKIADLHKPEIDEVVVTCKKCGKKVHRVPEVLDSWIEAGSAPYAERHFPFNKTIRLEDFFPTDFIVEYTGQIRAWFYVLHVIATALYDSNEFKNVVVTGIILGTDGRKMSKNLNNYPDPKELLQKYGGDALRLYLMGSPLMHGEDIVISEEQYRNQVKGMLLILWNVYNFFVTNAIADNWTPKKETFTPTNVLDRWILSRLAGNLKNLTNALEKYDTPDAISNAETIFIRDLSNRYVRRVRDRVGPTAPNGKDKDDVYQTLWITLTEYIKALAPIIPFTAEEIYRNLTGEESVHLVQWPTVDESAIQKKLEDEIELVWKVISQGHAVRKRDGIKVRMPIGLLGVDISEDVSSISDGVWQIVLDELNVKNIVVNKNVRFPKNKVSFTNESLEKEGQARDIIRQIQQERKKMGTALNEQVAVVLPTWPKEFEEQIKKEAFVASLIQGSDFVVKRV